MAHSELKAYSVDEEIEESHEDETKCVRVPSFAPDAAFAPDGRSPRGLFRRTRSNRDAPSGPRQPSSVTARKNSVV